jgi:hypothetical protein
VEQRPQLVAEPAVQRHAKAVLWPLEQRLGQHVAVGLAQNVLAAPPAPEVARRQAGHKVQQRLVE